MRTRILSGKIGRAHPVNASYWLGSFQAVLLIAAYLDVPLRYPLRFGGSRSYVHDHAPSVEPTSPSLGSSSTTGAAPKPMEFPLFLEGQDSTRAAYAVFLLNKVSSSGDDRKRRKNFCSCWLFSSFI